MIVVESAGIGVGKTVFASMLADRIPGAILYRENMDGVPLAEMYEEIERMVKPSRAVLQAQYSFLYNRYNALLAGQNYELKNRKEVIFDRSLWGDLGFANKLYRDGFLTEVDFATYRKILELMCRQVMMPHAVIRPEAPEEICIKRINLRMQKETGRECETSITPKYLRELRASYDDVVWPIFTKANVPVLRYEWVNGAWDSFPPLEPVLEDLQKLLPRY